MTYQTKTMLKNSVSSLRFDKNKEKTSHLEFVIWGEKHVMYCCHIQKKIQNCTTTQTERLSVIFYHSYAYQLNNVNKV